MGTLGTLGVVGCSSRAQRRVFLRKHTVAYRSSSEGDALLSGLLEEFGEEESPADAGAFFGAATQPMHVLAREVVAALDASPFAATIVKRDEDDIIKREEDDVQISKVAIEDGLEIVVVLHGSDSSPDKVLKFHAGFDMNLPGLSKARKLIAVNKWNSKVPYARVYLSEDFTNGALEAEVNLTQLSDVKAACQVLLARFLEDVYDNMAFVKQEYVNVFPAVSAEFQFHTDKHLTPEVRKYISTAHQESSQNLFSELQGFLRSSLEGEPFSGSIRKQDAQSCEFTASINPQLPFLATIDSKDRSITFAAALDMEATYTRSSWKRSDSVKFANRWNRETNYLVAAVDGEGNLTATMKLDYTIFGKSAPFALVRTIALFRSVLMDFGEELKRVCGVTNSPGM